MDASIKRCHTSVRPSIRANISQADNILLLESADMFNELGGSDASNGQQECPDTSWRNHRQRIKSHLAWGRPEISSERANSSKSCDFQGSIFLMVGNIV